VPEANRRGLPNDGGGNPTEPNRLVRHHVLQQ
jgi:hypothetical protein